MLLSIARFIIPAFTLVLLLICFGSLFFNRTRPMTIAKLVNEVNGEEINITHWETSIGRSKVNDIVLENDKIQNLNTVDKSIERYQAVITKNRSEWRITNIVGNEAVCVNSESVTNNHELTNGDAIQIGNTFWRFVCSSAVGTKKKQQIRQEIVQKTVPSGRTFAVLVNSRTNTPKNIANEYSIIGSDPSCDVVINHPSISPKHARIEKLNNKKWAVRDLGSQYGTKLNGDIIRRETIIESEDILSFGNEEFIFYTN